MPLKKVISEGDVSAVHKKNLPTHASDAKKTEPDKLEKETMKKEVPATAKAKADLPTHSSDAKNTEPEDEVTKKVSTKVDPALDGEKIAKDAVDGDGVVKTHKDKDGVKEEYEKDDEKEEEEVEEEAEVTIEVEDDDEEDEEDKEEEKAKMKEHVEALVSGEDLSEEFRTKAETIFEAAVSERVAKIKEKLQERYEAKLEKEVAKGVEEISEQLDNYLTYVAEEYIKENALAIETGVRHEITESFIEGLKELFEAHNIDIPQEKVSLVDELTEKVTSLEEELNKSLTVHAELKKEISELERETCLAEACKSLSDTDSERLRSLAENLAYDNAESFKTRVEVLKESYFGKTVNPKDLSDEALENGNLPETDSSSTMNSYCQAITRSIRK